MSYLSLLLLTRTLRYRIAPENATDRNLYWYCGNMPTFSPIGLDQILAIPSKTKPGEFLVYDARNDMRQIVCRLRVDVVAGVTKVCQPDLARRGVRRK